VNRWRKAAISIVMVSLLPSLDANAPDRITPSGIFVVVLLLPLAFAFVWAWRP
jgi:hypothetical protein